MGIDSLKKFLKDRYPGVFRKTNMYTFHKCKISIDASILGYKYWFPMQKRVIEQLNDPTQELDISKISSLWLNNIWNFIGKLLRLGITPVLVFDGEPPAAKADVINQRREEKRVARAAIDTYIKEMKNLDPIARTRANLAHMKALYNKWNALSGDHFQLLKIFFQGLGIPVLQATNEAEELCTELVRAGSVSAAYCKDIDCLAHLVPVWIFDKTEEKEKVPERNEYIESFEYLILDELLKELEFTRETFVDFCIMCGCDYNKNIPLVGAVKAYKLLREYHSIENIIANKQYISILKDSKTKEYKDLTVLKYQDCRELFKRRSLELMCKNPNDSLTVDFECVNEYSREYLQKCEMEELVQQLDFIYAAFPRDSVHIDMNKLIPLPPPPISIDVSKLGIDFSKLNLSSGLQVSDPISNIPTVNSGNTINIDISKFNLSNLKL